MAKKTERCPVCWARVSKEKARKIAKIWFFGNFSDLMLMVRDEAAEYEARKKMENEISEMRKEIAALKAAINPQISF